ncbi:MAG: FtsX-like permease family protein [Pseudomonadota bacterium]
MRHHLAVLFRNMGRERLYAAINIAGLALGLASSLILGLFLRSELSYDRHLETGDKVYRVINELTTGGRNNKIAATSEALGPMLAAEYPDQIKAYVRLRANSTEGGLVMRRTDQPEISYAWDGSYFADANVFDVFPHRIIAGDPHTALVDSASIAISARVAKKYFGSENPIGRTIMTDSGNANRVTLVFADLPANSHLKYDLLFSYNQPFLRLTDNASVRRAQLASIPNFVYTYLVMQPAFRAADWPRLSGAFMDKYMKDLLAPYSAEWHSWLQPLRDMHLQEDVGYDRPHGNRAYLLGCMAVALIILAIACINYMNLATARATRRARAVGLRKILGASRLSLALQFLAEAVLFALLALVLALVIVEVVLRFTPINTLMEGKVALDLVHEPQLVLWLAAAALGMGILAGAYPAFYLSSWAPLTALSGQQVSRKGHLHIREVLVLLQFTISAAAIAATLLMMAQMHYVQTRPLGFERDNRLVVALRGASTVDKIPEIRNELLGDSRIRGVAIAQQMPAGVDDRTPSTIAQAENDSGVMERQMVSLLPIGEGYEAVMGLKMAQGRDLSARLITDTGTNLLVNEALVKKMGWTDPLGKRLTLGAQSGRVIGVVRDFNFKSLHHLIEPAVLMRFNNDMSQVQEMNRPFQQRQLILDITGREVDKVLAHVGQVMARADPRHPFEYRFLDEALDAQYKSELGLTQLIGIFAGISIFVACMGLFGLAAFTTEQRTHEIGTRKVLGATTWQIVTMLARRILMLVVIASAIAAAAAYFAIDEWLAGFAYRSPVNPLIFLLAAMVAATVAFTTVALQSWKTASADPVDSLRYR